MDSNFSVAISVYHKDNPQYVKTAINSISSDQTLKPSEIILIVDGPVPNNLKLALVLLKSEIPYLKILWQEKNQGLGKALEIGMKEASYDLVARMDADDISAPDRFEKQIRYMTDHPEVAVLGGQISEFIDSPSDICGKREVPITNNDCHDYLKGRCPFNHMTVMLRKERVLEVGNYKDWHFNEDYYLWIRMAEAGCKFANLPDTLVNVRVGKDMYARRGGWKYFKSEKGIQEYMLKHKMISIPRYLYNVAGRFAIQVAMPNSLRAFVFQKLFRK